MSISVSDLIEHLESQIKDLEKQRTSIKNKAFNLERNINVTVDKARDKVDAFIEESLKQPTYAQPLQSIETELLEDLSHNESRNKNHLQTVHEEYASIQREIAELEPIMADYRVHQYKLDTFLQGNSKTSVELELKKYHSKLEDFTQKQEQYAWLMLFEGKPHNWLEQYVNDGTFKALWNSIKNPELRLFYQYSRQERRRWSDLHSRNAIQVLVDDIQHAQDYIKTLEDKISSLNEQEQTLKQNFEIYRTQHIVAIERAEELYKTKKNKEQSIQETKAILERIVYDKGNVRMKARQLAKEQVTRGFFDTSLVADYQQHISNVRTLERTLGEQLKPVLSHLRTLEKKIQQTIDSLKRSLDNVHNKTRRLSSYDKRKTRLYMSKDDYASKIRHSYDLNAFDYDDYMHMVSVNLLSMGALTFGLHMSTDIDIPDISIEEPSINNICLPDISIPDIPDIPEINIPNIDVSIPDMGSFDGGFSSGCD